MDVAGRVERLRESFDDVECDALLVTNLVNIRYLAGFSGSAGLFAVMDDELVFVTDGRYDQQAHEELQAAGIDARIEIGTSGAAQRAARRGGGRRYSGSHPKAR